MWLIVVAALASGPDIPQSAQNAPPAALARFQRIDRDRDGFITANEAPRVALSRVSGPTGGFAAPTWIETYDSDGDSRVSFAEYSARSPAAERSESLTQR